MGAPAIPITGDDAADRLLEDEPLALLIGMLLDQQVPMEWAFKGPMTLRTRLGGSLDASGIASMDVEAFVGICAQKPAVHRFPASMGRRIHELCGRLADEYGGDAAAVWSDATSGSELHGRLRALPGFGEEKTKIFIAILAKRFGIRPDGWETAAAPFSDDEPRSVADVDSEESLVRVREWKRAMKAARKSKQDNPA
jgi:uncharacterized HhH-GPD family protein